MKISGDSGGIELKVILCPSNHDYIKTMKEKLIKKGIMVETVRYITPFTLFRIIWLRFQGYCIIHIHFVYSFPLICIMKTFVYLARFMGYKLAWTGHDIVPHEEKNVYKNKWFYRHTDIRFIHHKAHLGLLNNQGLDTSSKICHIHHPCFNTYPNNITKRRARQVLDIPLDKKVILAFGYIKQYKGLDYFVNALRKINNGYYGLIVGTPFDKDIVKQLKNAESKMNNLQVVTKYVQINEIQNYMNACDVCVLPYRYIWTSGAAMLAYGFSRPIVASQVGCMDEIITDETGVLVKPEDAFALAEGIKVLFSKDYEQMGRNAYKLAIKNFSWDVMIDKTIAGYRSLFQEV